MQQQQKQNIANKIYIRNIDKMPEKCSHTYIFLKDGCKLIRRVVYETEDKKKYIKNGGKIVMLADIRGKYRYADKLVQN